MNLELGQAELFPLNWHENGDCDPQERGQNYDSD